MCSTRAQSFLSPLRLGAMACALWVMGSLTLPATAAVATDQARGQAALPVLLSASPADGARDVAPDTAIEATLQAMLSTEQLKRLSATLIGPGGVTRAAVDVQDGKRIRIKPAQALLPASTYTVMLTLAAPAHADKKTADLDRTQQPQPLTVAVIGWRTRALAAEPSSTTSMGRQDDPYADETFHPSAAQRHGDWYTHRRYPYSREMVTVAQEQQTVLGHLPPQARERLKAHMQDLGEYVPPEVLAVAEAPLKQHRAQLASSQAGSGGHVASLSGQILRLDGQPLADVSLRIGVRTVRSNALGEFTLDSVPVGEQVLVVDAQHAHRSSAKLGMGSEDAAALARQISADDVDFGRYEYRVNLVAGNNELPQTIWLTRIDHAHAVHIDSPTKTETVITHPDIPGLEVRLPAGTVIRDADGQLVREVSLTPIPLDQMPVPMPFRDVGVYYTLQPGGAHIESADGKPAAATLNYPNYTTQLPGARRQLFDYDPQGRSWYVYGEGWVSADGQRIESTQPFKIYQFALTSYASSGGPSGTNPPGCSGGATDGDPVICSSGVFYESTTDLSVQDVVPITISRTYHSNDSAQHAFGVGSAGMYDAYLYFPTTYGAYQAEYVQLVQSDGVAVNFQPINWNNIDYSNGAAYQSNDLGPFLKAQLAVSSLHTDWVITQTDGSRMGFSYYNASLKWLADRFGNTTYVMRDSSNRVSRIVSPNGRWVDLSYAESYCTLCVTQATDHTGRAVKYAYDDTLNASNAASNPGQLLTVTAPDSTTTTYTWDHSATVPRIKTIQDGNHNTQVTNTYYSNTGNTSLDGRTQKQVYADGSSKSFTYAFDSSNNLTAVDVTDQRGTVRHREFDSNRYVVKDVYAQGTAHQQTWLFQRDPVTEQVTLETDPLNRQTQYQYDANGNETSRTVMYGTSQATTWSTTYEPVYNQPLVSTDPLNHQIKRIYDSNTNLQEVDDGLGHKTTYSWYANGQLQSITRWPGTPSASKQLTTNFTYDNGDLKTVTDPLGRTTTYNVDGLGRVVGIRDPASRLATRGYDAMDRLSQRCNAKLECANFQYDGNGNLKQFTRGATERDFVYDSMNRLYTEGNNNQSTKIEKTITYSPTAGTQTVTEASGRTSVTTFDELWRTSTVQVSNGGTNTRSITYNWDAANRLQSIADSVAGTISYSAYDNRFDAVTTETGPTGTVNYAYYANGLVQTVTPAGGTVITYGFDAANRLQTISQAAGSGNTQPSQAMKVSIAYDNANRRQTLTLANGVTLTYGWDDGAQLSTMSWMQVDGKTAIGTLNYGYDSLGRRTSIGGSLARFNTPPPLTATVGTDGRIATENGTTLQYDANGRLKQDATYIYTWNDLGQLSQIQKVSDSSVVASYTYDPIGRRNGKTVGGVTTKYLYNGANPIQIQNSSGTPTENLLAGGVDEWFVRTSGGQSQHYLTDALGSTIELTDGSGNKLAAYTYDPYGGTSNDTPSNSNLFQYAGREYDGNGVYFYRARYYMPAKPRFLSQDLIGLAGGDGLYQYVSSSPLSYVDPYGRTGALALGGAGVGEGTGLGAIAGPAAAVVGAGMVGWQIGSAISDRWGNTISDLIWNATHPDDGSGNNAPTPPAIPPGWKGDTPPAPGWEWHGPDAPGGERGGWVSPDGEQSLHPDPDHGGDIGPHVDWNTKNPKGRWRIFPDGRCEPK